MTYRILFAPDGKHWIDDVKNNRKDPSLAVMQVREFEFFNPFAKTKVINVKTGQAVYETKRR